MRVPHLPSILFRGPLHRFQSPLRYSKKRNKPTCRIVQSYTRVIVYEIDRHANFFALTRSYIRISIIISLSLLVIDIWNSLKRTVETTDKQHCYIIT